MMKKNNSSNVDNVYKLDGRVPIAQAIPFGLQHILAMFVSNLAPVSIVCGAAIYASNGEHMSNVDISQLLLCAMFVAGIGTLIQLYPIMGRIGSGLPVVMGVSFTFLASMLAVAKNPNWGYEGMIGAIIVGGVFEGLLGLTAKYWRRFISPIVSGCVVTTIGLSLLSVGMESFGGGSGAKDFGAWYNLLVAFITLVACLLFKQLAKGVWKNLNVLFGLIIGYIVSVIFTLTGVAKMVDFATLKNTIGELGIVNFPHPVFMTGHMPTFHLGAIIALVVVFIVSAAETIGDTTAVCTGGLCRDITEKEVSGSLAIDGFGSAISGLFGCCPITSFSQNVGMVAMTKVVNRFTIGVGAFIMIACAFFPPLGAFFASLPASVLGGCTIMMFGSIMFTGMEMISKEKFTDRNMMVVALSFCIGVGVTLVSTDGFFHIFPKLVGDIFQANPVAGVFIVAMILDHILPGKKVNTTKSVDKALAQTYEDFSENLVTGMKDQKKS